MYNIDFSKLIQYLLTSFKRGLARWAAWLEALLKPLAILHADFISVRNRKLYEAQITGQVKYLEKLLNDTFWTLESGGVPITITDAENTSMEVLIYNTAEQAQQTMLYNKSEIGATETLIYNINEGTSEFDFVVNIDVALVIDYDLLHALLAKYKLPGTSYTINIIQ